MLYPHLLIFNSLVLVVPLKGLHSVRSHLPPLYTVRQPLRPGRTDRPAGTGNTNINNKREEINNVET